MNKTLIQELIELLGPDSISTSEIERIQCAHDMAPVPKLLGMVYKSKPDAVVRPKSPEQLQQLVKFAAQNAVPLTPRGRATTMMGGAYPVLGGISVDMTARRGIIELNESGLTVKVAAGTNYETVLKFLSRRGLTLYSYPSSAPSATVAGWLANSAMGMGKAGLGIGSSRFGYSADSVVDLGVALASGEYLESVLTSGHKVESFLGSDGILGIIDTVTLKVRSLPLRQEPFSFNFKDIKELCAAVKECISLKPFFVVFEDENLLGFKKKAGLHIPQTQLNRGNHPAQNIVTIVLEGDEASFETDVNKLRQIIASHGGQELARQIAWAEWEDRFRAMNHKKAGPNLLGGEFTAPLGQLTEVIRLVNKMGKAKNLTIGIHGTLGVKEIVLMPQVLSDQRKKFRYMTMMSLVKELNDLSVKVGGAPYGAGLFNAFYAKQVHGAKYNELVKLKKQLDPHNIMNPGKGICHWTRFRVPLPKFAYGFAMGGLGLFVKHG
ncbi:MAG: FAD-binding oxidoreductase [Syntrophomonas sp.]|nr:FAD-binding oxidoreductase [Syntrophomonas sp.]